METFLYRLTLTEKYADPAQWSEATDKIIMEHFNWMKALGEKGTLVFAGRTTLDPGDKNLFGIALIFAKDIDECWAIMKHDPGVAGGVQQSEIFPFRVALDFFPNYKKQNTA